MLKRQTRRGAVAAGIAACISLAIIAAEVAALPYISALATNCVVGALVFFAPALPWIPAICGVGEGR